MISWSDSPTNMIMQSSIFTDVKERVDFKDVVQYYGFEVNRGGFLSCPFHSDKTPSLKVYDEHFYCFGCGEHGDAIAFVGKIFNLSPLDAARKLASDFGIAVDSFSEYKRREKPVIKVKIDTYAIDEQRAYNILQNYHAFLKQCRVDYAPQHHDEALHPLFAKSLMELDKFEHYVFIFITGKKDERIAFMKNSADLLDRIERELQEMEGEMPTKSKIEHYTELLQNSVNSLSEPEKWLPFLETSARIYKYKFRDKVMIHAQRPGATACADYDLWRRPDIADRQVMRGSKGIALLDDKNNGTNLKYVFDVADTEARSEKQLFLWQINDDNRDVVVNMLKSRYGAGSEGLDNTILETAKILANEYGGDYANELIDYTEGTFLEELDDYNVWVEFSGLLENSIAYTLLERCGYNPTEYFELDDFKNIRDFNGIGVITALGKAVSELSEQALRDIEKTVKIERRKQHEINHNRAVSGRERNDVPVGRNDTDLSPRIVDGTAPNVEDLRTEAAEIPAGTQADPTRNNVNQGDVEQPLDGTRPDGADERGTVNLSNGAREQDGREVEIDEPNEVGTADEQLQEPSGGNNSTRVDIPLSKTSAPVSAASPSSRERDDLAADGRFGGFLPPEHLETILKSDLHMNLRKQEILEYFLENEEPKQRAEFMKSAYNHHFTPVEVDGLLYAYQKTADNLDVFLGGEKVRIPWHDVQERVADLIAKHDYLDIAGSEIEPAFFTTPTLEVESQQMSLFGEEVGAEKPVKSAFTALDEEIIKIELLQGSNFEDGKFRIDEFAKTSPNVTDFAKLLRDEYGTGGSSGTHESVKFSDHDSKGIRLRLHDERRIDLTWNAVAKRVAELIKNGEYITESDIAQRIKSAEYVINNYDPADEMDLVKIEKAEKILAQYGLFEDESEELSPTPASETVAVSEIVDTAETPTISELDEDDYPDYLITEGDILELDDGIYEVVWICDGELKLKETTTDEIISTSEDELYNSGFVVVENAVLDDDITITKVAEIAENPQSDEIDPMSLIGKHYVIDGREMIVESVNVEWNNVNFLDVQMYNSGYPISRSEKVDFLLYIEQQERENAVEPEPDITDIAVEEIENVPEIIITPIYPKVNGKNEIPETPKGENFRITDENLGVGGAKEKFKNNIAAIELLKEIERAVDFHQSISCPAGTRPPYPNDEEKETLSRYVGWGGLSQAFDESNPQWANEYQTLKNTLSTSEYESVRESTLNAHYTSPTVIKAIYEGLENLGFKSGNVLEPATGVGNFFGMLPESMQGSKLYGVELDDVSGRIAKQLYPNADISIRGFEEKQFSDNFFDVAVGNVPFGGYKLSEKRYDKLNLNVHDHFFAKALDKVRPGGVVAFVTSKGTLDKQNSSFRKYLAERAELLGAVRLPNTAFKANAGTEVTSDIIFLQKRESVMDIEPEWVKIGRYVSSENVAKIASIEAEIDSYQEANLSYSISWETRQENIKAIKNLRAELDTLKEESSLPCNKYFISNPDMMLGIMTRDNMMYGNDNETTCKPFDGADLSAQLKLAIANIQGKIPEYERSEDDKIIDSILADERVKNFSFTLVEDKLYYRENSRMNRIEFPKATEERIKAMVELRDCVRTLIDYQLNEYSESDIREQQFKLNNLYDKFNKKHGLINNQANRKAFGEDSSYYLLTSLEVLNEQGELERKADMFTKRTINQQKIVTSVDTASEALAVSIAEKARVDLDFMSELSKLSKEQIIEDLQGVIYKIPSFGDAENYATADDYLSGNIREKLETARNFNEGKSNLESNIRALEQVMPKPLSAADIDVRLGVNWVETEYIKQFVCETLQTPFYAQRNINVKYSDYTAEWQVEGKNSDHNNVLANMKFGTGRKNAYAIIEDSLNLRDVRIFDYEQQPDGSKKAILNKKETMLAQEKQETLKQAFKDWIFKDPDRRERLVGKYNEMFNSTRPREYDGSHITFSGMNPEITLNPHQRNAVAHALYGGNTLFAHCVGAGKTYEMVATAMESKRLGLCHKSLIVVPNHISEQFGSDFLKLYPSANILVATKKDFEMKNRRRLCAKIACGDYDAVIIGHSQLEKIPISPERQERLLRKQIRDITRGIEEIKYSRGEKFSVKQLEKTKKSLEARLKKLIDSPRRDDVVTFEELGVDKLIVDEAHCFKEL